MKQNDLTLDELNEIAKEISTETTSFLGKRKEVIMLKSLDEKNIHYEILKEYELFSNSIIIIPLKKGIAINYGHAELGKSEVSFSKQFQFISEEDMEKINEMYAKNKKQNEIIEKIYESQKIRGLFEKMKATNS
jgi:hypothetical protein